MEEIKPVTTAPAAPIVAPVAAPASPEVKTESAAETKTA